MKTIKLPSGAELGISDVDFKTAHKFFKLVSSELQGVEISREALANGDIGGILELVLRLVSSDKVNDAIIDLLPRCMYNGQKLTLALLDNEEVRKDFLPIEKEIAMHILSPFLAGLGSFLNDDQSKQ